MEQPLKIYACLTNNHTKVISLSFSKIFPVMVECALKDGCPNLRGPNRYGKMYCGQSVQMEVNEFGKIKRGSPVPDSR